MTDHCPLCTSENLVDFEVSKKYLECTICSLRFLKAENRLDKVSEKQRYLLHHNNIEDPGYQNFVKFLVAAVKKRVAKSDSGLDFGCGPSSVVSHLLHQEGFNITGYDPYFKNFKEYLNLSYDYIILCEVLEHIYFPRIEIEILLKLLKNKKFLFIKTELYDDVPSFDTWYYKRDQTHVCFYSVRTMAWIKNNFGISYFAYENGISIFSN